MKKMYQALATAVILLGGIALAGCSSTKAPASSSSQSSKVATKKSVAKQAANSKTAASTSSSSQQSQSSKPAAKTTLWDGTKSGQLNTFVAQFGQTMGQDYVQKTNLAEVVAGVDGSGVAHVLVNDSPATLAMSTDGTGAADYNVVGLYYHEGTMPPLPNHITYFFAFQNGQPVALVDQSRDGGPRLGFTQNTEVKGNFAQIVNAN